MAVDAFARQTAARTADLNSTAAAKGSAMIGFEAGMNGYSVPSTLAKLAASTIHVKSLGAIGDGTLHPLSESYPSLAAAQAVYPFATSLAQSIDWCAIQLAQLIAYNSAAGCHPDIDLGFGMYVIDADIQCYAYTHMRGRSAGTSHSQSSYKTRGYQTTLMAAPGYNGNMLLFNTNSQSGNTSITDTIIRNICFRGNWTGPGDATNTTGRAIYFNGVYLIQNSYIEECEFHNFAEEGVFCNVVPIPVRMRRLWGRYLGGPVVRIAYNATRGSHSGALEDIQGDFVGAATITTDAAGNTVSIRAGLVLIDGSLRVDAGQNAVAESWAFKDFKHEINSSASSTTAYAPDTIVFHSFDRATVHVANVNTMPSDPIGIMGTPITNAIIDLTGTKTPFITWSNCRLGSPTAVTDYVLQDGVNGVNIAKEQRSGAYMAPVTQRVSTPNATDVILSSRVRSEASGIADARDQFSVTADGALSWTNGTASVATDMTFSRIGTKRMALTGTLQGRRLASRGQGAVAGSAFALAGWGSGATVVVNGESNDSRGSITITAGTAPSANPTIVLTYADNVNSPWPVNPFAVAGMGRGGTGGDATIRTDANTATMTLEYRSTPVAGSTYVINYIVIG